MPRWFRGLILAIALQSPIVSAQTSNRSGTLIAPPLGTLLVTVADQQGAVIAKAHLALHSNLGEVDYGADDNGLIHIYAPPGHYQLSISAPYFASDTREVDVAAGSVARYTVPLKIDPKLLNQRDGGGPPRCPLYVTGDLKSLPTSPVIERAKPEIVDSFEGTVYNSDYEKLANAKIEQLSDDGKKIVATTSTDAGGHFKLHSRQRKLYLQISASDFDILRLHAVIDEHRGWRLSIKMTSKPKEACSD